MTVLPEAVEVTEPVPVEVRVTLVPDKVPARETEELVPVFTKETIPEEVRLPEPTVMVAEFAESVNVTEEGLLVVLEMYMAVAVSVNVTLAVVSREMVVADVVMLPMLPAPVDVLTRFKVPDV